MTDLATTVFRCDWCQDETPDEKVPNDWRILPDADEFGDIHLCPICRDALL